MDGFFEKYGRMIIVAVAICFVLLYLTPMRNVVGSSINGFVGNFANKVGESLGTVRMPDGSDNITWEKPDGVEVGKQINIEGTTYYILKQTGNNKFLVCSKRNFNTDPKMPVFNEKSEGTDNYNIYENGDIDNYFENTLYPSFSTKLKNAIELTEITQASYNFEEDRDGVVDINNKYDTNYKGQKYNTLKRHVYLPSVEDLQMASTDVTNTRDAVHNGNDKYIQYLGTQYDKMFSWTNNTNKRPIPMTPKVFMCHSFIVNLSKVDYSLLN